MTKGNIKKIINQLMEKQNKDAKNYNANFNAGYTVALSELAQILKIK